MEGFHWCEWINSTFSHTWQRTAGCGTSRIHGLCVRNKVRRFGTSKCAIAWTLICCRMVTPRWTERKDNESDVVYFINIRYYLLDTSFPEAITASSYRLENLAEDSAGGVGDTQLFWLQMCLGLKFCCSIYEEWVPVTIRRETVIID